MTKPKSLFKLARNKIFEKGYLCEECNNLDQNFIQKYGEYNYCHVIKIFVCKDCSLMIRSSEIIYHVIQYHQN